MLNQKVGELKKKSVVGSNLPQPIEHQETQLAGLLSGTRVATPVGWSPVQTIGVGDEVLTFDCGLQEVTKVDLIRLWNGKGTCPSRFWPLEIPAKALGNRATTHVLPGQNLMIESDAAEALFGDPFTLIPAGATEGIRGVKRTPPEHAYFVVLLHFSQEQVVYSQSGALLFCPAFDDTPPELVTTKTTSYSALPMHEARYLAEHLGDQDSAACTYHPQGFGAAGVPA